jgi:hypothetical protein
MPLRAHRTVRSLFTGEEIRPAGTHCPVCGHRTAPVIVRYSGFERVLAVLCLLLAAYIVADFAHDGHLNGSLPGAIMRVVMSSGYSSR